jgi:phosphatidylglycerophosphate synthase
MNLQIELAKYIADKMPDSITPNHASWFRLVFAILAGVLFSFGDYYLSIAAVLVFHFSLILNRVDGFMARKRNLVTRYGVWLNEIFDDVKYPIIVIGIAIGYPSQALAVMAGLAILFYLYHKIILNHSMFRKYQYMSNKSFGFGLPTVISHSFESVSGLVLRYSMVVLALAKAMELYVLVFMLYSIAFCTITFYTFDSRIRNENAVIKKWKR